MPRPSDISHWLTQVKQGDSLAAAMLWQHAFDRLVRAVRQRLRGENRAVSDEEDLALSVFESFYAAAEKGRFPDLTSRDDLWRLLMRMAARKVIDVLSGEPSPDMVLMMQESVEQLFSHLGVGPLRDLAVGKLEGLSNAELAEQFACSERTIERRLHLLREKLQQEMVEDDERSPEKTSDRSPGTD